MMFTSFPTAEIYGQKKYAQFIDNPEKVEAENKRLQKALLDKEDELRKMGGKIPVRLTSLIYVV